MRPPPLRGHNTQFLWPGEGIEYCVPEFPGILHELSAECLALSVHLDRRGRVESTGPGSWPVVAFPLSPSPASLSGCFSPPRPRPGPASVCLSTTAGGSTSVTPRTPPSRASTTPAGERSSCRTTGVSKARGARASRARAAGGSSRPAWAGTGAPSARPRRGKATASASSSTVSLATRTCGSTAITSASTPTATPRSATT
jgi:hypothetical protein